MRHRAPRPRSAVLALHTGAAVLAAAALGSLSLAMLAPAAASAQSAAAYVALGDSYSSGVGAGSYIGSSGSCDQSTNAYPALWDAANQPASYVSEACSGATTATVLSSQLGALSSATTLVSITVGGNDVGFSSVMETCVLLPTSSCVSAVQHAEALTASQLPGELDSVLNAIHARRGERPGRRPGLPGALRPVEILVLHRPEHDRPDRPQSGCRPARQPDSGGRGAAR